MPVRSIIDWHFYYKFSILFDTRKRHPQLFEARLHKKVVVSAIHSLVDGNGRVLRMTNGFGYFCQNKSNIRAPKIWFKEARLCREPLKKL